MITKDTLKSKTFFSGLALVLYGIVNFSDNPSEAVNSILSGLSIIFLRDAIAKK
jgi:hypothetical protein